MDRSLGFGSTSSNSTRYSHSLSLRLRPRLNLAAESNSQAHYAKGMRSPGQARAPTLCRQMISGTFHSPRRGAVSPFPHGTSSLSVTDEYLALEGGPPGFGRSFTCSALLGIPIGRHRFSRTGLSPSTVQLSKSIPLTSARATSGSRNPAAQAPRFRLFRVRSPLLAKSRLMSFPPGTEMFHFPGYRSVNLWIQLTVTGHDSSRVAPFGNLRITVCLPLPGAYRNLPRPSSPISAKASFICPL